ncbi:MAG TPA: aminofutalosine synthase MqnE, partial [Desulfocapsa sulfexigens]|nr:aminofutalosine synthase MqnE [Desulfocapsa sulfexigens]
MIMKNFIEKAGFGDILEKVEAGERLSCDDGIRLYNSNDILSLGYMANIVRNRINGD